MAWRRLSDLVSYQVSEEKGQLVVKLAGELDVHSSRSVRRLALEWHRPGRPVVFDLARVSFADAGGMSGLVSAHRRLKGSGGQVVIRRPHRSVRRLLEVAGMDRLFEVEPTAPLAVSPDLLSICAEALDGAIRISGAERGNVQLMDAEGALRILVERGFSRPFLDFFAVVEDQDTACGRAGSLGRPVWIPNVARSPIFWDSPGREVVLDADVAAVASVPVRMPGGAVAAVISVHHARPTDWTDDQRQQLEAHADLTSQLVTTEAA